MPSRAAVCAAGQRAADLGPIDPAFDYHSYANVDQFRTTHLDLDMRVDLKGKTITGAVTLELKRLDPRATQLVLDTKDLMILDVRQKATDVLGATAKNQTILGQPAVSHGEAGSDSRQRAGDRTAAVEAGHGIDQDRVRNAAGDPRRCNG